MQSGLGAFGSPGRLECRPNQTLNHDAVVDARHFSMGFVPLSEIDRPTSYGNRRIISVGTTYARVSAIQHAASTLKPATFRKRNTKGQFKPPNCVQRVLSAQARPLPVSEKILAN